jgi:excisionase family DNA binding protein
MTARRAHPAAPLPTRQALTAPEAAAMVGVSAETVRRWVRRGECPFPSLPMPGRLVRFSRSAVERYLAGGGR